MPDLEASEDVAGTRVHMERVRQRGWDRFVSRHRRKDGRIIDIEASAYFVPVAGGRFVSFFRDSGDRLRAEEKLRISEERFRALSESAPVGIFEDDADGNNVYANAAAAAIWGMTLEEARGGGWQRSIHPDDRERAVRAWREALASDRRGFTKEHRFLAPGGG